MVRQWRRIESSWSALPLSQVLWSNLPFRLLPSAAMLALVAALLGCLPQQQTPVLRSAAPRPMTADLRPAPGVPGDPNNGMALFTARGCVACHTIRPMDNATGAIGPNLTNMALRPTIAGEEIQNTPDNMVRWIMNPPAMKAGARMPVLGVSDPEARDLTAFLYSLPYNSIR